MKKRPSIEILCLGIPSRKLYYPQDLEYVTKLQESENSTAPDNAENPANVAMVYYDEAGGISKRLKENPDLLEKLNQHLNSSSIFLPQPEDNNSNLQGQSLDFCI